MHHWDKEEVALRLPWLLGVLWQQQVVYLIQGPCLVHFSTEEELWQLAPQLSAVGWLSEQLIISPKLYLRSRRLVPPMQPEGQLARRRG